MDSLITYDILFRIIKCDCIVFFEDEFSFRDDKNSIVYGFARMNETLKDELIYSISESYNEFYRELNDFNKQLTNVFGNIKWNDKVIKNDFESVFTTCTEKQEIGILRSLYDEINIPDNESLKNLLHMYGLGVDVPPHYQNLFNEYIFKDDIWRKFKIYRNYDANIEGAFLNDLEKYNEESKAIVCIIDNQLSKEKRAKEILTQINASQEDKELNIVAAVLSSKEEVNMINKNIFAEYVEKDQSTMHEKLKSALVKSSYSILLKRLKAIYMEALNKSFDNAIENPDIAAYLSKMASYEGITNYKVITNWIEFLLNYEIQENPNLLEMIRLTRLIEGLEDGDTCFKQKLLELNTFEAFDYNVNKYFQSPAAGDIFINEKGEYYVLVGQDCDMITSQTRNGNNAVSEFVKAEIVSQDSVDKITHNLEYMSVDNFMPDSGSKNERKRLRIKYSKRFFVDNVIVKLACYNDDGKCKLNLQEGLEDDIKDLLPMYVIDNYTELTEFFNAVKTIKERSPEEMSKILKSTYSPRLIALDEFRHEDGNKIEFGFRRICRLNKTYILYLYKLFLDYRGRHPFDSINLVRHYSLEAKVTGTDSFLPFDIVLSSNRKTNRNDIRKLDWYIKPKELEEIIKKEFDRDVRFEQSDYLAVNGIPFFVALDNGKRVKLTKKKKNELDIEII